MKNKELNAVLVWKQMEDQAVPRLRLTPVDHAIYSYLLRHSRLEGKLRLRFSIPWLAHGARVCPGTAREAVRRLVAKGALRLIERTKAGHVVEVRVPEEIRATRSDQTAARNGARSSPVPDLEKIDFLQSPALRQTIHAREDGACFYCLKRLNRRMRCLDHVVPRVQLGRNSYRNLVSCCADCNSQKSGDSAKDFLRKLYRGNYLTFAECHDRMRALDVLAAGKLRPVFPNGCQRNGERTKTSASGNTLSRKFRPPFTPTISVPSPAPAAPGELPPSACPLSGYRCGHNSEADSQRHLSYWRYRVMPSVCRSRQLAHPVDISGACELKAYVNNQRVAKPWGILFANLNEVIPRTFLRLFHVYTTRLSEQELVVPQVVFDSFPTHARIKGLGIEI